MCAGRDFANAPSPPLSAAASATPTACNVDPPEAPKPGWPTLGVPRSRQERSGGGEAWQGTTGQGRHHPRVCGARGVCVPPPDSARLTRLWMHGGGGEGGGVECLPLSAGGGRLPAGVTPCPRDSSFAFHPPPTGEGREGWGSGSPWASSRGICRCRWESHQGKGGGEVGGVRPPPLSCVRLRLRAWVSRGAWRCGTHLGDRHGGDGGRVGVAAVCVTPVATEARKVGGGGGGGGVRAPPRAGVDVVAPNTAGRPTRGAPRGPCHSRPCRRSPRRRVWAAPFWPPPAATASPTPCLPSPARP